MGAVFGGSSQTIFGSSGPGTFLGKMTTAVAIIFMLTSFSLSYTASRKGSSLMEGAAQTGGAENGSRTAAGSTACSRQPAAPAPSPGGTTDGKIDRRYGESGCLLLLILTKPYETGKFPAKRLLRQDSRLKQPVGTMACAEVVESGRHAILRG